MIESGSRDFELMTLVRAIAAGDAASPLRLLAASPALARGRFAAGATRQMAKRWYLDTIERHVYAGDTALHIAAAAYGTRIAQALIAAGADVRARNRHGAEPLHSAVVGSPGSRRWNPRAQAATIAGLIEAGADPSALDNRGVSPLHCAVRTRCAAAVRVLLANGADAHRKNGNGSTPMLLATQNTGRGGSGSPQAKAQQKAIERLLEAHGATR